MQIHKTIIMDIFTIPEIFGMHHLHKCGIFCKVSLSFFFFFISNFGTIGLYKYRQYRNLSILKNKKGTNVCFPKAETSVKKADWRIVDVMPIDVITYPGSK